MYIDFHYYMIKVLAVKAGFAPDEAEDIAYASEYIDDALEFLPMKIDDIPDFAVSLRRPDGQFDVVCTAHDETTMLGGALVTGQERTYMPFHFVPRDTTAVPKDRYDYRTAPDCPVARGLVDVAIRELKAAVGDERTRKLIKLGIALHTFADTWAHRDFSGRFSGADNAVANLEILKDGGWEAVTIDTAPALVPETGHAKAHSYPDSSHIHWRYHNGVTREFFDRDNPALYLDAAETIYRVLCDAAGRQPRWPEIRDRVADCIRYRPCANIWIKKGIDDKVAHYIKMFPEIFPGGRETYDEWAWRRDALQPYRVGPDGRREMLAFEADEFNMRKLVDKPKAIAEAYVDSLKSLGGAAAQAWAIVKNGSDAEFRRICKPLIDWYQTMRATRYACKPGGLAAKKWFFFNLEAAAQRQYVMDHAYPIGQAWEKPVDEMYEQSFTVEQLRPQIEHVIAYALENWKFKPSPTLAGKAYWMAVTVENRTPYPVVWRGHYDGDFTFDGGHGRYWDRPDRGGTLQPGQARTFTVCERDNAATGSAGVALFEIDVPRQAPIPFSVAFSQPLLDDELHALKLVGATAAETVGNVGRDVVNGLASGLDWVSRRFDKTFDERVAPVSIKVEKRPKCRASFSTDRSGAYAALGGNAQVHNGDRTSFSAGHISLATEPGREARVVISH